MRIRKQGPCSRCKINPRSKGSTYCNSCQAKKAKAWREAHPYGWSTWTPEQRRKNSQKTMECRKANKSNLLCAKCKINPRSNGQSYCPECVAHFGKKWRSTHPDFRSNWTPLQWRRHKAGGLAAAAVRRGQIKKKDACEICGENPIEMHHPDETYSKPLEIVWLCKPCHIGIHQMMRYVERLKSA